MSRVPHKYKSLAMLDDGIGRASFDPSKGRTTRSDLPPRWEKLFAVARAEGIYQRWINRGHLVQVLARHTFSVHPANEVFGLEHRQLAHEGVGVLNFILGKLEIPYSPGLAIFDICGGVSRLQALEIVTNLKFELGSGGLVVEKYPAHDSSFALVRVVDPDLARQQCKKSWVLHRGKTKVYARVELHTNYAHSVVSDEEVAAILARPPAEVDYSLAAPSRSPDPGEDRVEALEREAAELRRRLGANI